MVVDPANLALLEVSSSTGATTVTHGPCMVPPCPVPLATALTVPRIPMMRQDVKVIMGEVGRLRGPVPNLRPPTAAALAGFQGRVVFLVNPMATTQAIMGELFLLLSHMVAGSRGAMAAAAAEVGSAAARRR